MSVGHELPARKRGGDGLAACPQGATGAWLPSYHGLGYLVITPRSDGSVELETDMLVRAHGYLVITPLVPPQLLFAPCGSSTAPQRAPGRSWQLGTPRARPGPYRGTKG